MFRVPEPRTQHLKFQTLHCRNQPCTRMPKLEAQTRKLTSETQHPKLKQQRSIFYQDVPFKLALLKKTTALNVHQDVPFKVAYIILYKYIESLEDGTLRNNIRALDGIIVKSKSKTTSLLSSEPRRWWAVGSLATACSPLKTLNPEP